MRRVTMMLAAMAVMVPLFAGVAYAATIEGTGERDVLLESNVDDTIFGRERGDFIFADFTFTEFPPGVPTGADTDVANGNTGPDFIVVDDGDGLDTANGGPGDDTCFGDPNDTLNCETENPETTVVAEPVR
jgi:Ca2+-binding RTX toxin-like protein